MKSQRIHTTPSSVADACKTQLKPVIYLLDDDPSLLRALSRRLSMSGFQVETFQSARAFLNHPRASQPCCAVIDLQMSEISGLEVQNILAADENPPSIVFLTAHGDIPTSVQAMKGGAVDFLTKPVLGEELIDAVNRALVQAAESRKEKALSRLWNNRYATLTPSERQVFALIVNGLPNKGIAAATGVSERTVKAHRAEVMRKMHVQSPAELGRTVEWIGDHFVPASPP